MAFKDNLAAAISSKGWTHERLAEELHVSRAAVTQWLLGTTMPKGTRLEALADALDTTASALFGGTAENGQVMVPVVGYVGGGEEVYPIDDGELGTGLEHVPAPPGSDSTLVAVIVRGSSMVPAFWEGDLLFYTRSAGFDRSECLYRECVVKLVDGRTFVKHVMPGSSGNTYTLSSYNSAPIIDVDIEWAAPVQFHDMRRRRPRTELKALVKPKSARRPPSKRGAPPK